MGKIFTKGIPINEDRIGLLETVVERLARRSRKGASVLITPFPISSASFGEDVRGPVLLYMFPCEGTITKGMIRLGSKPKSGVKLTVRLYSDLRGTSEEFTVEKKMLLTPLNISVNSGDRLSVSIEPIDQDLIKEVWVSFLWVPTVKDVEAKSFLFDEIENENIEGPVTQ